MKTQSNFLVNLTKTEMTQLTKEVKETLASNCAEHKTIFSAADLWNIQKTRRTIRTSRRLFV